MNQKELKELIDFLIEKDIAEFELERGDVKVRIKRGAQTVPVTSVVPIAVHGSPAAAVPAILPGSLGTPPGASSPVAAEAPSAPEEKLHIVHSPIVGTYYESPSPGSPPFVGVGDKVETGQVLCIVEAMKLMNEIESDMSGEIVKKLVSNGQPVEYGQDLFAIRPK
ncbi:MAG: acetyl-CoA carboxylase biotin carboxyl carrier protein [Acidobacteriaceae bacterium]|nr:acetyl-CoA carboxylase biotin carboxyl carrier protein [Acidobacteriaceae bacterium]